MKNFTAVTFTFLITSFYLPHWSLSFISRLPYRDISPRSLPLYFKTHFHHCTLYNQGIELESNV